MNILFHIEYLICDIENHETRVSFSLSMYVCVLCRSSDKQRIKLTPIKKRSNMWWKLSYHRFIATREWMALERCLQPPFHLRNVWMIYSMRFIMNLFFSIKFTWCRHCVWHGAKCDCFHSKCCAVLLLLAGWSCVFFVLFQSQTDPFQLDVTSLPTHLLLSTCSCTVHVCTLCALSEKHLQSIYCRFVFHVDRYTDSFALSSRSNGINNDKPTPI